MAEAVNHLAKAREDCNANSLGVFAVGAQRGLSWRTSRS